MRGEWQQGQGRFDYYFEEVWKPYYASINRRGEIKFNEELRRELKSDELTVLWNAEERWFGLTGWEGDSGTYMVRTCGRDNCTSVIRIARVLKQFGIEIDETREFRGIEIEEYEGEPLAILALDRSVPFRVPPGGYARSVENHPVSETPPAVS